MAKFTVRNTEGTEVAGDDRLDATLQAYAYGIYGYITNTAGEVVYDARPADLPDPPPTEEEPTDG